MTGRRRRGLRSTLWDGLDTGDVVGTSEVSIHPKETPDSLRKKLDLVGAELLVRVVQQIERGTYIRTPQSKVHVASRTRPKRSQLKELERRLPHWRRRGDERQIIKIAAWLVVY